MTKAIRHLFLLSIFLVGTSLYSQSESKACKTKSTTIKGTYNGKNLFFQNSERNGIQKILLDKKEIATEPNSPTFELLLTDLKKGQKFELTIVYCDTTPKPYKILNEDAIK